MYAPSPLPVFFYMFLFQQKKEGYSIFWGFSLFIGLDQQNIIKEKSIKDMLHMQCKHASLTVFLIMINNYSSQIIVRIWHFCQTLSTAPNDRPSLRTLINYAVFLAIPSRQTLIKIGKPSKTLIIRFEQEIWLFT